MKQSLILLLCLWVHLSWAQSGEGFNPVNPGDPDAYYRLSVETASTKGGSASPTSPLKLAAGQKVRCSATTFIGYKFKQWMIGDKVVSAEASFTYTMPEEDVALIAYFDWVGNGDFNPYNPDDPFAEGFQHKVTLYATPSVGGSFNSNSFYLTEDKTCKVYAYPSSGYRFVSWNQNGKVVSTDNPLEVHMGKENLEYTAQFVFDPVNPSNPEANHFNKTTGELVISDFESGRLSSAIYTAIGTYDDYSKVKTIVVGGSMQVADFGFMKKMTACRVVDLSHTSGYDNVPDYAFADASALEAIILPHSMKSVGRYAFRGCERLTTMFCCAATPPIVTSTTFFGVPSSMAVLVPSPSLALYQSANYWNKFAVSALDGVEDPLRVSLPEVPNGFDKPGDVRAIYSVNGTKMTAKCLNDVPSGTYIIYSENNGHTKVSKYYKGGSKN